jgi:hypothetical protein
MQEQTAHICNPIRAQLAEQQAIIEQIVRAYYLARLIARRGLVAKSASMRR